MSNCSACACSGVVSTVASGLLAGAGVGITVSTVPAINASKDPLPSWKRLYKNGSKLAIGLIITTTGTALKAYHKTEDHRFLCVAGTAFLLMPYTVLVMKPTNDALFAISDDTYKSNSEEEAKVLSLIQKWDKLQYVRTALGVAAFGLNVWILTKKLSK